MIIMRRRSLLSTYRIVRRLHPDRLTHKRMTVTARLTRSVQLPHTLKYRLSRIRSLLRRKRRANRRNRLLYLYIMTHDVMISNSRRRISPLISNRLLANVLMMIRISLMKTRILRHRRASLPLLLTLKMTMTRNSSTPNLIDLNRIILTLLPSMKISSYLTINRTRIERKRNSIIHHSVSVRNSADRGLRSLTLMSSAILSTCPLTLQKSMKTSRINRLIGVRLSLIVLRRLR